MEIRVVSWLDQEFRGNTNPCFDGEHVECNGAKIVELNNITSAPP